MKKMGKLSIVYFLITFLCSPYLFPMHKKSDQETVPEKDFLYGMVTKRSNLTEEELKKIQETLESDIKKSIINACFPDEDDVEDNTLLHFAVYFCHMKGIKLLIFAGADINSKNFLGETPLHRLLTCAELDSDESKNIKVESKRYLAMIRYLISLPQINLDLVDYNGKTVLDYAYLSGYNEIVNILSE